ncbi:MAG: PocR ligand-binding domain-containing protein [Lachnospiraceae bacterium]
MGERVITSQTKNSGHQINETNIYNLVKKGVLTEIQEKLHQVTNMAFVTIDYRGEPVTEISGCTEFCICRRKYSCYEKSCCLSNAYGGAMAAINNEPYIYKCPVELINMAIPIIIDQQYMGALIGGQVRCEEDQQLDDYGKKINDGIDWRKDKGLVEKYGRLPVMSFDKIQSVADLAFLYISQMCEKENTIIEKRKIERKKVHLQVECKKMKEREETMEEMALSQKKGEINLHFILNILNAISGIAYVEDANQTGEMIQLLTQMMKYHMRRDERAVTLEEELDSIRCYLQIQKLRFEDKMTYEIIVDEEVKEQMLPPGVLLPFVENAVSRGIITKAGGGNIKILCYMEEEECVISVEDERDNISSQKLKKIYEPFRGVYEPSWASADIYAARQRLMRSYGSKYDAKMIVGRESGRRVLLRIPSSVERIRSYV